jgi:hypothetical protein
VLSDERFDIACLLRAELLDQGFLFVSSFAFDGFFERLALALLLLHVGFDLRVICFNERFDLLPGSIFGFVGICTGIGGDDRGSSGCGGGVGESSAESD